MFWPSPQARPSSLISRILLASSSRSAQKGGEGLGRQRGPAEPAPTSPAHAPVSASQGLMSKTIWERAAFLLLRAASARRCSSASMRRWFSSSCFLARAAWSCGRRAATCQAGGAGRGRGAAPGPRARNARVTVSHLILVLVVVVVVVAEEVVEGVVLVTLLLLFAGHVQRGLAGEGVAGGGGEAGNVVPPASRVRELGRVRAGLDGVKGNDIVLRGAVAARRSAGAACRGEMQSRD